MYKKGMVFLYKLAKIENDSKKYKKKSKKSIEYQEQKGILVVIRVDILMS